MVSEQGIEPLEKSYIIVNSWIEKDKANRIEKISEIEESSDSNHTNCVDIVDIYRHFLNAKNITNSKRKYRDIYISITVKKSKIINFRIRISVNFHCMSKKSYFIYSVSKK